MTPTSKALSNSITQCDSDRGADGKTRLEGQVWTPPRMPLLSGGDRILLALPKATRQPEQGNQKSQLRWHGLLPQASVKMRGYMSAA